MKRKCTLSNGKQTLEFDTMSEAAKFLGFNSHGFSNWHLERGYAKGWKISTGDLEPCYNDITGMKFGRLTALYPEEIAGEGRYEWVCKCDCGNLTRASSSELKRGTRYSCGCSRKTHGMSNTRLYHIWNGMKQRCGYEKLPCYKNYGGRGISFHKGWESFDSFMVWALANGYSDDLTLDRIDNNKGYSPDNCRWSTKEEQNNNQRTNRKVTCNGETRTISQWSRISGVSRSTILYRLNNGMPPERAIFLPVTSKEKPLIAIDQTNGEILCFKSGKDAERHGHTRSAIWKVINGEYGTHHGMIWKYAEDAANENEREE